MRQIHQEVDCHLICVIYFSDKMTSSEDISKIWTALRVLRSGDAEIIFKKRGDTRNTRFENSSLGSDVLTNVLNTQEGELDYLAVSVVRPDSRNAILDSDVNFIFQRNGIWDGEPAPPRLELSVSARLAESVGSEVVLQIFKLIFKIADSYCPFYGLVDVARSQDAAAGMVYGTAWPRNVPLNRWLEQMAWIYSAAKKHDRVRSIYWGNYFGSRILDRLGGRKDFLETCVKNARNHDGSSNGLSWEFSHGVFFGLTLDPLDCRPGLPFGFHPAAEFNLRWLIHNLGTSGVLNHW